MGKHRATAASRSADHLMVVSLRRRSRGALMVSTALQAVVLSVLGLLGTAFAQLPANTLPTGGSVIGGKASISRSGNALQVTQTTNNAAVNWNSFSIGSAARVHFAEPNAQSMVINRVVGPDPSVIAGRLTSNGQVVLVNQSGVVFARGAMVDVQSLIVSAPGITEANAKAGRLVFDQPARAGAVVANHGTITVGQTGLAALVAPRVVNSGVIRAQMGRVVLAGAEAHTIDLYGDGLLSIDVTRQVGTAPVGRDGQSATTLVTNTGIIQADGGTVLLTASAIDGIVQNLVSAGGTISAATVAGQAGRVIIGGTGGSVVVQGTIAARGEMAGTMGGQIQVNTPGSNVTLAAGARLDASGRAGGGTIAVGTTLARARGGPGTMVPTARNVTIERGATLAADATRRGNGGNVTVLSAGGTTRFRGDISGRGGDEGGNGGFVELSGDHVTLGGRVHLGAPMGKGGTVLLDPTDLDITLPARAIQPAPERRASTLRTSSTSPPKAPWCW